MFDIYHDFPVAASRHSVFEALTSPEGLDEWWTLTSTGEAVPGSTYELFFGPEYSWKADVSVCEIDTALEWTMTEAESDWLGTRVGFRLEEKGGQTWVRFYHTGWSSESDHYRMTSFCWAMYLRILKRYIEQGETVPYADRLNV